jgi:hypothetical protein
VKSAPFVAIVAVLAIIGGLLYAQRHRRDEALAEAQRASTAAGESAKAVDFQWEYSSCPPENQAVYAEWNRRLVDAKTSLSRAADLLDSGDPDIQLLRAAELNQSIIMHQKHMQCLERQSSYLDSILHANRSAR